MGYWHVLHCPRGRASLGHRWEPTPCPSWGKNEQTTGSLSQAGREAGQTSEGAHGLVAWVGLLSRKWKWGKKKGEEIGRVKGKTEPGPRSPSSQFSHAHHTYGVDGVPLRDGPHAQSQDGEVGPRVGAREHDAAPAVEGGI